MRLVMDLLFVLGTEFFAAVGVSFLVGAAAISIHLGNI